ncbi:hypothetical protein AX774_g4723 [Zancudomyces culisetae]|uniref:Uncharacterized protein n=1 Tax=Zancudomyces culisetae TaxID=1213189 RepID=A0A1R1PLH5_ZANCU|nr:hypothetical protein AX774_g4723 [Zancudomyces culisetae]|eukprot:OMH81820.1 hypothetical protein AX774_g4723 [Zancudomyces culisetae]
MFETLNSERIDLAKGGYRKIILYSEHNTYGSIGGKGILMKTPSNNNTQPPTIIEGIPAGISPIQKRVHLPDKNITMAEMLQQNSVEKINFFGCNNNGVLARSSYEHVGNTPMYDSLHVDSSFSENDLIQESVTSKAPGSHFAKAKKKSLFSITQTCLKKAFARKPPKSSVERQKLKELAFDEDIPINIYPELLDFVPLSLSKGSISDLKTKVSGKLNDKYPTIRSSQSMDDELSEHSNTSSSRSSVTYVDKEQTSANLRTLRTIYVISAEKLNQNNKRSLSQTVLIKNIMRASEDKIARCSGYEFESVSCVDLALSRMFYKEYSVFEHPPSDVMRSYRTRAKNKRVLAVY